MPTMRQVISAGQMGSVWRVSGPDPGGLGSQYIGTICILASMLNRLVVLQPGAHGFAPRGDCWGGESELMVEPVRMEMVLDSPMSAVPAAPPWIRSSRTGSP